MTYAWDNDSPQNAHIKQMRDDRQKAYMEKHRDNKAYERSDLYAIEIDTSTICRCIGSQDKNGKLIYENDIVWDSDERAFYEIIWNQEDMCWNVEDTDGHKSEFEECYGSTIEVNGNRFDNPELLENER